jgi:indole-3-glycerol phosphate synthase
MQLRSSVLGKIVEAKRREIESAKAEERRVIESGALGPGLPPPGPGRDFAGHLRRPPEKGARLIAEIKRASPSKGDLLRDAAPEELATLYEASGAAAISVLTEREYFRGSLDDLRAARGAVQLPVLRKDFIIDEWQIRETVREGPADAILLIAALLEARDLEILQAAASDVGMAALVEVHDEAELDRALEAEARIIGINNRNLETFEVDLGITERLRPRVPRGLLVVAESGISSRDDIRRMEDQGVDAVLVGEALVTSGDPGAAIRDLLGAPA